MKKPVRIEDVAAAAGVSPMTVSRVMNNTARVRAETRAAVMVAVERLGYRPNAAARNLARAGAGRIGLLYSNPSPGYLSAFLLGALDGAHQVGAQLLLEKCDADPGSERAALARLAAGGVVGVILPPPHGESRAALMELEELGLAAVAVAPGRYRSRVPSIRIDDFAAAAAMTRRLLQLGHRRIGFIKGAPNQSASAERLRGFEAEMARAGGDVEALIESGEFTYRSGFDAAERLLGAPGRPTAIFASNDDMAAAAIAAAHRHGLEVPRDLSVVGFDDTPTASEIWPALTTIRQPVTEMAQMAVAMLSRAQGDSDPDTVRIDHLVTWRLVIRDSDGPPPGGA
ncbi:MAG TPA: LacI family DNA-binding transcriptional regulator [Brevundimonas sp.]|jgi:LacI family transcriptional regulator|uniref:LacI family DNA-binding transcriptional regulator n=1 Tax=Brevundimonas sp. TaxID=1871086 RepID=UPI002E139E05|nr:LacI family DNA-binding transcriptional regulator [Brevundimonas sp.]